MSTYTEFTEQVGEQWVAAIKRAEEGFDTVSSSLSGITSKVDLSKLPAAEKFAQITESLTGSLPKASEIVEANFALVEQVLHAQRDLTSRLFAVSAASAE